VKKILLKSILYKREFNNDMKLFEKCFYRAGFSFDALNCGGFSGRFQRGFYEY
jgi:hypothetical protein